MFATSRDILFIVLAVCIVVLTGFSAWFLYEGIRILRMVSKTAASIEEKLQRIDDVIQLVRDKLHDTSLAVTGLTKAVATVIQFFSKGTKKKKSKNEDDDF